jgi:hypothetical protein
MKSIILEGGLAAQSLINKFLSKNPDNAGVDLQYSKINSSDIPHLLPRDFGTISLEDDGTLLGKILASLANQGLIDPNVPPKYRLGSTRLAATSKYGAGSVRPEEYETEDIIQKALQQKTTFGDLDIDVVFTGDPKEIIKSIVSLDPSSFAGMSQGNQINLAIRQGNKVFQVDLVDTSHGREKSEFLEKSSFVDLTNKIKGAFSIVLLRAITTRKPVNIEQTVQSIVDSARQNPESRLGKEINKEIKNGWEPFNLRFALGVNGLILGLDFRKLSKDGQSTSRKRIDIDDVPRVGFENLDLLAQTLLDDSSVNGATIYHATKLAEFIRDNKTPEEKKKIWDLFEKSAELNIKKGISEEDYEAGMSKLAEIIGVQWDKEQPLMEGRVGIGRFVGKNEFNKSTAFDLLRQLVVSSGAEGQQAFEIDLATNPSIQLVEKMDSMFCHFGIDANGKYFMESSNSGPVYSDTADKKFGFSTDLIQSFRYLETNQTFQKSLRRIFEKIGPFRYDAELFPVLTHQGTQDGKIIFVGTPYSRQKFGKYGAFNVFHASLWKNNDWNRPEPKVDDALTSFLKKSSVADGWGEDWRIYTNTEDMKKGGVINVNLGPVLASYLKDEQSYQQGLNILSSRQITSQKRELVADINSVSQELQAILNDFANTSTSNLGDEDSYIEGVVLIIKKDNGDTYEVKGTSDVFNERKKEYWENRVDALQFEEDVKNIIATEILGVKTTNPASLNKIISQADNDFQPTKNGIERRREFFEFLIPYLAGGNPDFTGIKQKAQEIIKNFQEDLKQKVLKYKENKSNIDVDSARKTDEFFNSAINKFDKVKKAVNANLDGLDYYVNLLDTVLGFRIDRTANFETGEQQPEVETRKKVIIWNGRAQPWHVGHDNMVQIGKKTLEEVGADAVYIMIVKGTQTSQNIQDNPLNEAQQIQLISSVYSNDPKVIVSQQVLKSSFLLEVINNLYNAGYEIAGWLAGEDRIDSYMAPLRRFNPSMYQQDHDFSPVKKDENGNPKIKFIQTPRVMSGTKARNMAVELDFDDWIADVAPPDINSDAIKNYGAVYNIIRKSRAEQQPQPALESKNKRF